MMFKLYGRYVAFVSMMFWKYFEKPSYSGSKFMRPWMTLSSRKNSFEVRSSMIASFS